MGIAAYFKRSGGHVQKFNFSMSLFWPWQLNNLKTYCIRYLLLEKSLMSASDLFSNNFLHLSELQFPIKFHHFLNSFFFSLKLF